jgi:hypothetical protein
MADFSDVLNQIHGLIAKRVQAIVKVDNVTVAIATGTLARTQDQMAGLRTFGDDPDTIHLGILPTDQTGGATIAIAPSKIRRVVLDPIGVEIHFDHWSVDVHEADLPTVAS